MEKVLDLRMSNYQALSKNELLETNGGDPSGGLLLGIAAALVSIYEIGKAVGREIYYETHCSNC